MKRTNLSRRDFLTHSAVVAAPGMLVANALAFGAEETASATARKLKVVCVGGHPDDPESGCAGTLARHAELGHAVTIIYLTRGEGGIAGKSNDEAASIRSAECEAACKIIGAQPVFAGQIDGSSEFNKARVEEMKRLIAARIPTFFWRIGQSIPTWIIKSLVCSRFTHSWPFRAGRISIFLRSTAEARRRDFYRTLTWISRRCWKRKRGRCSPMSARTARPSGESTTRSLRTGADGKRVSRRRRRSFTCRGTFR